MYKLIAIDLDDTLLGEDLTISERNINAIKVAVDKGVKVILASGRATPSVKPYLDILNLKIPLISYQGARIEDTFNNKTIYKKEIDKEVALPIIKYAEQKNIHCNIYMDDVIYVEQINKWSDYYHNMSIFTSMEAVGKLSDFISASTTKIILIDEHEVLLKIKDEVTQLAGEHINVFFSKPNFLEFTNKSATKGEAVKFVADIFDIKQEEVIAIGDTYNDIPMISYAGLGVCVANGTEATKEIADYITLSNEEDGVAHVIEKYILEG